MRIVLILTIAAAHIAAQTPPAFEVASIKPSTSLSTGASFDRKPGMLSVHNASLLDCIREAYGVGEAQVSGGSWLKPERYDIVAKMPAGSLQNERAAMLQSLLAERFQLAVHQEKRQMQVYALVIAKGGHKLQAVDGGIGGLTARGGQLHATAVPLSRLTDWLAGPQLQLGHPVVDRTGLSGLFTFALAWNAEEIFPQLEEQLGLKLEASKGLVDVIVVDHAAKPAEN